MERRVDRRVRAGRELLAQAATGDEAEIDAVGGPHAIRDEVADRHLLAALDVPAAIERECRRADRAVERGRERGPIRHEHVEDRLVAVGSVPHVALPGGSVSATGVTNETLLAETVPPFLGVAVISVFAYVFP